MKIVANSSALIALSTVSQLDLLHQRFPQGILIPQAVWDEVVSTGSGLPGAKEVETASWITVCAITNTRLCSLLRAELDIGEAEAIVLGVEQAANVMVLDEKDARRVAQRLGLNVLGTVGLLIWAKRQGLISCLREQLDLLKTRKSFRLSSLVYAQALQSVGEILGE